MRLIGRGWRRPPPTDYSAGHHHARVDGVALGTAENIVLVGSTATPTTATAAAVNGKIAHRCHAGGV